MAYRKVTRQEVTKAIDAMMLDLYKDRIKALVKKAVPIFKQAHFSFFRDDASKVQRIPKGWLNSDYYRHFNVRGMSLMVYYSGRFTLDKLNIENIVAPKNKITGERPDHDIYYPHLNDQNLYNYRGGVLKDELGEQVFEIIEEQRELNKEINNNYSEVYAAMTSFNSVEKLFEAWPQIRKYYPLQAYVTNLPMVQIDKLNEKLGLTKRAT